MSSKYGAHAVENRHPDTHGRGTKRNESWQQLWRHLMVQRKRGMADKGVPAAGAGDTATARQAECAAQLYETNMHPLEAERSSRATKQRGLRSRSTGQRLPADQPLGCQEGLDRRRAEEGACIWGAPSQVVVAAGGLLAQHRGIVHLVERHLQSKGRLNKRHVDVPRSTGPSAEGLSTSWSGTRGGEQQQLHGSFATGAPCRHLSSLAINTQRTPHGRCNHIASSPAGRAPLHTPHPPRWPRAAA